MNEEVKTKHPLKDYFHSLLDMRSNMLDYDELHDMMEENTVIHGANMWILMMAILIASIGLNVNSTAVIIGAMLISPLMSGILTMGYSLAIRDLPMLRHAASRFATQVVISLITSVIYFKLSPLTVATSEMIARTSPTLWDVMIALFGGIAGSIGNTRKKASNVIPGVAIATALMPPLCTAGYGIATMQLNFILGAGYLFIINTLFIALSALIVTKLLGVPVREELDAKKHKRISRIITVLIIVTVIPSILVGAYTVYSSVLERNIADYLENEFVFSDTQLVQSSVDKIDKKISVSLVGMQVSDEKIAELESRLDDYDLDEFTIHVTQNKSIEGENSDKVTIAVQENTIHGLEDLLEQQQQTIDKLENDLKNHIDCADISKKAGGIFTKLRDCECGVMTDGNSQYLLFSCTADGEFSDDEQQTLTNWLTSESGMVNVVLDISQAEENEPDESTPDDSIKE